MEFPGGYWKKEHVEIPTRHSFQLITKRSGVSKGVLRKTHVEFPWVFVF